MKSQFKRTSAYLSILLIAGSSTVLTANDNGYLTRISNWWHSEECRGRKAGLSILAEETGEVFKNNPRTALATGLGAGVLIAGAPVTGGIMAATALALNNNNNFTDTTQTAFSRIMESVDNGRAQLNAELRETLHTGMIDLQNIGTAVTNQIGLSADRAIDRLGQATNDLTLQLGKSTNSIVTSAGHAIEGNIAQLRTTGEHLVNALNNTTQNFGTETRRSTQFFFRTLLQTLGFGSLGFTGAALFYKNIMNHTGEKSTIFASIGAGITVTSIMLAKLMYDRDCAVETAHAQERAAQYAANTAAATARDEARRNEFAAQNQARHLEALTARTRQLAQQKPVADPAVARACSHAQTTAEKAEKLAASLAHKTNITPEEQADTLRQISLSLQAARKNLILAQKQFNERVELATTAQTELFAPILARANDNAAERLITEQTLAQEKCNVDHMSKHNIQLITQQLEQLKLAKRIIHAQFNNPASSATPSCSSR